MKTQPIPSGRAAFNAVLMLALGMAWTAPAATLQVWQDSPNPAAPYTNWDSAAHSIQDAVDAAQAGDTVVVTNGVYATGGRAVVGTMTNRVAVDKAILLRSVNGPEVTVIAGAPAPAGGNGNGAIRCVYLAGDAVLSGFTLTNGFTRTSGNYPKEKTGGGAWCESSSALTNCILTGNSAGSGGGVYGGTLRNCNLAGNSTPGSGGGAQSSTLHNCTVTANSGGGVIDSTLHNCTLTGNAGEGAQRSTLYNCFVTGSSDAGAQQSTLYHCTVTGNSRGVDECTLFSCIVYFNSQGNYFDDYDFFPEPPVTSAFRYSCTFPLPPGKGNISSDPRLAGDGHLSAESPCIGAGGAVDTSGTDIDGEPWGSPSSIGCDEYVAGATTGPLRVVISAAYTQVATGFTVDFVGSIAGSVAANTWGFGDGGVVSNQIYGVSHAWAAPGTYPVVLTAYNETSPGGVSATVMVQVVERPIHYVNAAGTNPVPPYSSWATAATSIQDAVDVATQIGAEILVTNGVYSTGRRAVSETIANRVAVDKAITLRSVNGPEVTTIDGLRSVRCVLLGTNAVLNGFTLTNGYGGGASCNESAILINCMVTGNSGIGVSRGTLNNCIITGNSGGGVNRGTLNNCIVTGNSHGGAYGSTLHRCTVAGNSAYEGGGASESILFNCTLNNNSADYGGGAIYSTLYNCTVTRNSATYGGGAYVSGLYNCRVSSNTATDDGGGIYWGTLNNCTVIGNSADVSGGGVYAGVLYNCIVYFNSAPYDANYRFRHHITPAPGGIGFPFHDPPSELNYCITTPYPHRGTNNIVLDPRLADDGHLSADSPCIGSGSVDFATGTDIDGQPWGSPPSIGCDEYVAGAAGGSLSVTVSASDTNVAPGFSVTFSATIDGFAAANVWDFGDGTTVSNRLQVSHAWSQPGTYSVAVRASNQDWPGGIGAVLLVNVSAARIHYVGAGSTGPVPPYDSWATAAASIQDAVDVAQAGETVLVTNGVYAMGGTNGNRVKISQAITVQSVNGPEVTVIDGLQTVRCISLEEAAVLKGFTLTNGRTSGDGGGVWCADSATLTHCIVTGNSARNGGGVYGGMVLNCTLTGNSANQFGGGAGYSTLESCTLTGNSASEGGGVDESVLRNCVLTGNSVGFAGGGANLSELFNCVLSGNSAVYGGGALDSALYNCTATGNSASEVGGGIAKSTVYDGIVYFNTAPDGANHVDGTFNFSCTTPLPGGTGNITNAPLFVNTNNWSDLHLRYGSPGIDAGTNLSSSLTTDLDGNPRPLDGDGDGAAAFDMGAYEFDARSIVPPDWFTIHGLDAADPQVVSGNPDHDSFTTFQEWLADTDPTNALSFFHIKDISKHSPAAVSFQSSANRIYTLWSTPQLAPADWTPVPGAQAIPGTGGPLILSDPTNAWPRFYRVEVNLP